MTPWELSSPVSLTRSHRVIIIKCRPAIQSSGHWAPRLRAGPAKLPVYFYFHLPQHNVHVFCFPCVTCIFCPHNTISILRWYRVIWAIPPFPSCHLSSIQSLSLVNTVPNMASHWPMLNVTLRQKVTTAHSPGSHHSLKNVPRVQHFMTKRSILQISSC